MTMSDGGGVYCSFSVAVPGCAGFASNVFSHFKVKRDSFRMIKRKYHINLFASFHSIFLPNRVHPPPLSDMVLGPFLYLVGERTKNNRIYKTKMVQVIKYSCSNVHCQYRHIFCGALANSRTSWWSRPCPGDRYTLFFNLSRDKIRPASSLISMGRGKS